MAARGRSVSVRFEDESDAREVWLALMEWREDLARRAAAEVDRDRRGGLWERHKRVARVLLPAVQDAVMRGEERRSEEQGARFGGDAPEYYPDAWRKAWARGAARKAREEAVL